MTNNSAPVVGLPLRSSYDCVQLEVINVRVGRNATPIEIVLVTALSPEAEFELLVAWSRDELDAAGPHALSDDLFARGLERSVVALYGDDTVYAEKLSSAYPTAITARCVDWIACQLKRLACQQHEMGLGEDLLPHGQARTVAGADGALGTRRGWQSSLGVARLKGLAEERAALDRTLPDRLLRSVHRCEHATRSLRTRVSRLRRPRSVSTDPAALARFAIRRLSELSTTL